MFVFQNESAESCSSSPVQEVSSEQGFNLVLSFFCSLNEETDIFLQTRSEEMFSFFS